MCSSDLSLTAGLGLQVSEAYPTLVQQKVDSAGLDYEVVNAGVSGDTSAGGLSRLDWALEGDVKVMLVALGGNDGLRGGRIETMQANLAAMIAECRRQGSRVLLVGMDLPPNYGSDYTEKFRSTYKTLAHSERIALVPFLFEGFGANAAMFQPDGIHPTLAAQPKILETVWARLRPLLKQE